MAIIPCYFYKLLPNETMFFDKTLFLRSARRGAFWSCDETRKSKKRRLITICKNEISVKIILFGNLPCCYFVSIYHR